MWWWHFAVPSYLRSDHDRLYARGETCGSFLPSLLASRRKTQRMMPSFFCTYCCMHWRQRKSQDETKSCSNMHIRASYMASCITTFKSQVSRDWRTTISHACLETTAHLIRAFFVTSLDAVWRTIRSLAGGAAHKNTAGLLGVRWSRVILDEAHSIRNTSTEQVLVLLQVVALESLALMPPRRRTFEVAYKKTRERNTFVC